MRAYGVVTIRYGDGSNASPQSPLLSNLSIPSSTLRSHNLEILIFSVNANISINSAERLSRPQELFLVPALETTASATGRFSTVIYPVHKALVIGDGLESAIVYARLTASRTLTHVPDLVKVAIGLDVKKVPETQGELSTVNLVAAEAAIRTFRKSLDNSIAYEHGWLDSGVSPLAEWLIQGSEVREGAMKPAVQNLIRSVLEDTAENIDREEIRSSEETFAATVPDNTRQELNEVLRDWAQQAHTELRDQLDLAFGGRRWRRLSWWKLFWRVDDVGMIATEVLERSWLVEAEKEIIWLAGRLRQAGLLEENSAFFLETTDIDFPSIKPKRKPQALGEAPPAPSLRDLYPQSSADTDIKSPLPFLRPWPMHIALARIHLRSTTLPPLQALAQTLLLQTLSTTTLTSALSALMYVSISTTSVYEAGAIAALGLVWSLRRLQKRWEASRLEWEGEVREEARRVLRDVEGVVGRVLREGGVGSLDLDGVKARDEAREGLRKAREVLRSMEVANC